jgi:hypothetical protein
LVDAGKNTGWVLATLELGETTNLLGADYKATICNSYLSVFHPVSKRDVCSAPYCEGLASVVEGLSGAGNGAGYAEECA